MQKAPFYFVLVLVLAFAGQARADTYAVQNVQHDTVYIDDAGMADCIADSVSGDSYLIGWVDDTGAFYQQIELEDQYTNSVAEYLGNKSKHKSGGYIIYWQYKQGGIVLRKICVYDGGIFQRYTYRMWAK